MDAIVFLDIDGVLNSAAWDRRRPRPPVEGSRHFDPEAVARLNQLTDRTGALIVVSSSWRQFGEQYIRDTLAAVGVRAVILGVTPILDDGSRIMRPLPRGREIQAWIDEAESIGPFVILDDCDDMAHLGRRLVRTDHEVGLTDVDVERAVKMLLRR